MKKGLKVTALLLALLLATLSLAACGETKTEDPAPTETTESTDATTESTEPALLTDQILVVTREDGSGTRSAFVELTGVLAEENGEDVDKTVETANVSQGTNEVITFVSGAKAAIGYISLGSLNDTVKAVKIEGVEANPEDVKAGSYKISRPFNICYQEGSLSDVAKDFTTFIMSAEGQAVVDGSGYITVGDETPYAAAQQFPESKITIQGSTSVEPVMAKIAEAYKAVQPNVTIEIQANGSSAGVKAAMEGLSDIGMASRELKDEEKAVVAGQVIAVDGIAVIVNHENPVQDLTMEEVRQIFTGEAATWENIGK